MKIFRIIGFLFFCVCGMSFYAYSQPCAGFQVEVLVKDQSSKTIRNARVEAVQLPADGTKKLYTKATRFDTGSHSYVLHFSLPKLGEYFKEDFILKASAPGFQSGELTVKFPECATRAFEFVLPRTDSKNKADAAELEFLAGGVSRHGKPVLRTVIRATGANGRIYEGKSDDIGQYMMSVPLGKLKMEVVIKNKKYAGGETTVTSARGIKFFDIKL